MVTASRRRKATCGAARRVLMQNRPAQNKKPATGKTGAGRRFQNDLPLAGGESPQGGSKRTLSTKPTAGQAPGSGDRKQPLPSGAFASARDKRVAAPHPDRTRVRFEFARRAHQREITPKVGINLATRSCQEESNHRSKKNEKISTEDCERSAAEAISGWERACGTVGDCGGGSRRDRE